MTKGSLEGWVDLINPSTCLEVGYNIIKKTHILTPQFLTLSKLFSLPFSLHFYKGILLMLLLLLTLDLEQLAQLARLAQLAQRRLSLQKRSILHRKARNITNITITANHRKGQDGLL